MATTAIVRLADPYRDTAVIDARAPRTNQTVVALVTVLSLVTGWWWLAALMGLQLLIGLTLGRRYCLPCLLYFEVIQPRLGEGPLEDSRPPRFANVIGAVVLLTSAALFIAGAATAGWVLVALVALLATLSATTGFCLGCWIHRAIHGECELCDVPGAPAAACERRGGAS
jgi:hypothetical protein